MQKNENREVSQARNMEGHSLRPRQEGVQGKIQMKASKHKAAVSLFGIL